MQTSVEFGYSSDSESEVPTQKCAIPNTGHFPGIRSLAASFPFESLTELPGLLRLLHKASLCNAFARNEADARVHGGDIRRNRLYLRLHLHFNAANNACVEIDEAHHVAEDV